MLAGKTLLQDTL